LTSTSILMTRPESLQSPTTERLSLPNGIPTFWLSLPANWNLQPFFAEDELSEITGLSDDVTTADAPKLFSDEQIVGEPFQHYRATGFPYRVIFRRISRCRS